MRIAHRQRRHALSGRFDRERDRPSPADHPSPAPSGRVRGARQERQADVGRAAVRRPKPTRIDDVYRARPHRRRAGAASSPRSSRPCSPTSAPPFAIGRSCRPRCARMRRRIEDPEGRAMLEWFADGAMTLLGYEVERPTGQPTETLGLFSIPGAPTDEGGALGAMRYFEARRRRSADGQGRAQVDRPPRRPARPGRRSDPREGQGRGHRRSCRPVDQPGADLARRGSAACCAAGSSSSTRISASIPRAIAARRLRHAVSSLPRDLLVNVSREFAARPGDDGDVARRPARALRCCSVRSILKGQLFTFVWLPREDLNTQRREAIGAMMEKEVGTEITSWSVETRRRQTSRSSATPNISTMTRRRRIRARSTSARQQWCAAGRRRSRRADRASRAAARDAG